MKKRTFNKETKKLVSEQTAEDCRIDATNACLQGWKAPIYLKYDLKNIKI